MCILYFKIKNFKIIKSWKNCNICEKKYSKKLILIKLNVNYIIIFTKQKTRN